MSKTGRSKTLHPIIMLNYVPRAAGQAYVCLLNIVTLLGQDRYSLLAVFFAVIQGLIWPNLALLISIKSKNPKSTEYKLLFLDSVYVGMWMTFLQFSLWPCVTFGVSTFMASIAVGGLRLGVQSLIANALGALIVIPLFGFHFAEYVDVKTITISILGIALFSGVMGYMTYYRARVTKITRIKLKKAYQEMDKINKILKEASASLELDNVMKIIFEDLQDVFEFDFVTIQITRQKEHTLFFKSVYGEGISEPAKQELEKIEVPLTEDCFAVEAYNEKHTNYVSNLTREKNLKPVDKKIQDILWYSSMAAIPVLIQNKVIGVLSFYSRTPMSLDEKKLESINFYITQLAIIINNALLYEELKNKQLEVYEKNRQLEELSEQLSRYLSPQIVKRIIHGEKSTNVGVERKKLTIFFSDIVGFTNLSDRIESEELTTILNSYLNEMTSIALKHGGTVDKYIGDAIMIFFGDPETKGIKTDAINCAKMAVEMRQKIHELKSDWESIGIAKDLHVRMGINTGYCAVGNFGSEYRVDYTVIGSTVNLASRLQSRANPDEILISHETYLLIKDEIDCEYRATVTVKGITTPVDTYVIL